MSASFKHRSQPTNIISLCYPDFVSVEEPSFSDSVLYSCVFTAASQGEFSEKTMYFTAPYITLAKICKM